MSSVSGGGSIGGPNDVTSNNVNGSNSGVYRPHHLPPSTVKMPNHIIAQGANQSAGASGMAHTTAAAGSSSTLSAIPAQAQAAISALSLGVEDISQDMASVGQAMGSLEGALSSMAKDGQAVLQLHRQGSQEGPSGVPGGDVADNEDLIRECGVCLTIASELATGCESACKDIAAALNHRCQNKKEDDAPKALKEAIKDIGLSAVGVRFDNRLGEYKIEIPKTIFLTLDQVYQTVDQLHHMVAEGKAKGSRSCCAFLLSGMRTALNFIRQIFGFITHKIMLFMHWLGGLVLTRKTYLAADEESARSSSQHTTPGGEEMMEFVKKNPPPS